MLKKLVLILCSSILCVSLAHGEVTTENIIDSAEKKVVGAWESQLSRGLTILRHIESDRYSYYDVRKLVLISVLSYDIKKTDSIVSPYKLILNFSVNYFDNTTGPKANGYHSNSTNKTYGYKTSQEALGCVRASDLEKGSPMDMVVYYALQKNKWVLKGGNSLFQANILRHSKTLVPLMAEVATIPVK